MLFQHKLVLVALFVFLSSAVQLAYASSSWSGWTRSTTVTTSYRRAYCSADNIRCRLGRDVSATRCPDRDYRDIVGDVEIPIPKSNQELFAERLTRNENSAIQFSREDDRYMTARMISTLENMVNELPSDFSVKVLEGYQDAEEGNATFPLQYEGISHVIPYTYSLFEHGGIRYNCTSENDHY